MKDVGVKIFAPSEWLIGQSEGFSDIKRADLGERWWDGKPVAKKPARLTTQQRIDEAKKGKPCLPCGKKKR